MKARGRVRGERRHLNMWLPFPDGSGPKHNPGESTGLSSLDWWEVGAGQGFL